MKKTNLVWLIIKNWFKLQYKFLSSKSVHLFVFIVVNVVIGSLGVWMTILMTRIVNIQSFDIELSKVLEASGPYTFAVAYLAASTSYVAYEYLEDRRCELLDLHPQEIKRLRNAGVYHARTGG